MDRILLSFFFRTASTKPLSELNLGNSRNLSSKVHHTFGVSEGLPGVILVSHEELSFKDRLYEYSLASDGWVEPLVYTREEVKSMLGSLHPLILDALKDGLVIYDRGLWNSLKAKFNKLLKGGAITPKEEGWITSTKG